MTEASVPIPDEAVEAVYGALMDHLLSYEGPSFEPVRQTAEELAAWVARVAVVQELRDMADRLYADVADDPHRLFRDQTRASGYEWAADELRARADELEGR